MTRSVPLTIIVAACQPSLGIGKGGALPWPMLKGEMHYFARVTKQIDPTHLTAKNACNAVIMGRSTWNSIPDKFRPLKGRLNIVVSSTMQQPVLNDEASWAGPYVVSGLSVALDLIRTRHPAPEGTSLVAPTEPNSSIHVSLPADVSISRTFVIGGSSLYQEALTLPSCERVLLTKVQKPFDCDVFFPLDLDTMDAAREGWCKQNNVEWAEWTSELLDGHPKNPKCEENGFNYEFHLYEREYPNK